MATTALIKGRWPVSVGDEIWLIGSNGRRAVATSVVEKIGHKLVHIKHDAAYYLENGCRRDGYSGRIQTKDQRVSEDRYYNLVKLLREVYGIELQWQKKGHWSVEAVEVLYQAARTALPNLEDGEQT